MGDRSGLGQAQTKLSRLPGSDGGDFKPASSQGGWVRANISMSWIKVECTKDNTCFSFIQLYLRIIYSYPGHSLPIQIEFEKLDFRSSQHSIKLLQHAFANTKQML